MQRKPPNLQTSTWLEFIINCPPSLTIPVGARFQADVPRWSGPLDHYSGDSELGTKIWPIEGKRTETDESDIGKGRSDSCPCVSPGSARCVKRHIANKRKLLKLSLGPAYMKWNFDEMGEEVANSWTKQEQESFASLMKLNPLPQGTNFLKNALKYFPSKSKESIVRYYFNVFIPRRIRWQTSSGHKVIDSDDDQDRDECSFKDTQKRYRTENAVSHSSKYVKSHYLTGRR